MRIFVLPPNFKESLPFTITGSDFHYIIHVLRLKKGDKLTGRDPNDLNAKLWILEITNISKNSCTLKAVTEITNANTGSAETTDSLPEDRPEIPIILYICIPKGSKLKQIIRMSTEIGVLYIIPVISKNCTAVIKPENIKPESVKPKSIKTDNFKSPNPSEEEDLTFSKYDITVKEALQQSGSIIPTKVCAPIQISDLPTDFKKRCETLKKDGICLLFHQKKLTENQQDLVNLLIHTDKINEKTVGVLIGSEGGFTNDECSFLLTNSLYPVLLKTNILRTETAVVYAISTVQAVCSYIR